MNAVRQGDILIIPATAPEHFERRTAGRCTVGYGEATGHHHVIEQAQWVVAPGTTEDDLRQFAMGARNIPVFVVATEETTLIHPEHDTIAIAPGVWRVIRQAQYSPQELRAVYD